MSTTSKRKPSKPPVAEPETEEILIAIDERGTMKFLYHDALVSLLEEGEADIQRASHVEPCGTEWEADMSPVGGQVLGPFPTRGEALAAEVAYLNTFYL